MTDPTIGEHAFYIGLYQREGSADDSRQNANVLEQHQHGDVAYLNSGSNERILNTYPGNERNFRDRGREQWSDRMRCVCVSTRQPPMEGN